MELTELVVVVVEEVEESCGPAIWYGQIGGSGGIV